MLWDLPFAVCFALAVWSWFGDDQRLSPLESVLAFFGIGGLPVREALFDVFAATCVLGLAYNGLVVAHFGSYQVGHLGLGLCTAVGGGLAWTWLHARVAAH